MKSQLALGDRVKLTERGVRLWGEGQSGWTNRRGTVRHIAKHSEAHVRGMAARAPTCCRW